VEFFDNVGFWVAMEKLWKELLSYPLIFLKRDVSCIFSNVKCTVPQRAPYGNTAVKAK
jgi:hypothetical protein